MNTTSILFAGVGGQGIILASRLLARCAFNAGFMVKESELHGMSQRGGSVTGHVRFGDEVYSPLIPAGKADYMLAMEELEGLRCAFYLKPHGRVVLNKKSIVPSIINPLTAPYPKDVKDKLNGMNLDVDELNAEEIAKNTGNPKVENIVLIGALSVYLPLAAAIWEETINESFPPKFLEINLAAFEKGRAVVAAKQ